MSSFEETSSRFCQKRLASSSETEQGDLSPPPLKRQRLTMQSHTSVLNGGCAENGTLPLKEGPTTSKANAVANGDCTETDLNTKNNASAISNLSDSDKEVIRLVGQHLCALGLQ